MVLKVLIYSDAVQDLDNLRLYLTLNFGQEKAIAVLSDLHRKINTLAIFPKIGRNASSIYSELTDYQFFRFKRNVIFYSVDYTKQELHIHRILSNQQDIIRHLQKFLH